MSLTEYIPIASCEHGVWLSLDCSKCSGMEASKAKHTPGPWMLHDTEIDTVVTKRKPGISIAHCDALLPPETCNANARLISAAPDMKNALEKAHRFLSDYWQVLGEGCNLELVEINQIIELALSEKESN